MRHLLTLAAVLLPLAVAAGQDARPILPPGRELAKNPGFEEAGAGGLPAGWALYRSEKTMGLAWGDHGIGGSKGLLFSSLEGKPAELASGVSGVLEAVEPDQEIEVTAWLRLDGFSGECVVWARCDTETGRDEGPATFTNSVLAGYDLSGTTIWSPVTIRVTPTAQTRRVVFGVLAAGAGAVRLDELHARVREGAGPGMTGPGLYRAEGRYRVRVLGEIGSHRVLVPVPILWRDQVPLDFRVFSEPPGRIASVRLVRMEHGFHHAEVVLGDLAKGEDFTFAWDSHVLAFPHEPTPIPGGIELPLAGVPTEAQRWLAATWCCDFEDEALAKVAAEVREGGSTADVVIPAILARMSKVFGAAEGFVTDLTAVEALTKRGSCTSCANLGAALLRAQGIPARIVAGYPTWTGPLQTHYVVEYWLPGAGWRVMETTRCLDDRPGFEQIEVAVVLPEQESEEKAGRRPGNAGGVPWLSLTEHPDQTNLLVWPVTLMGDMPGKPGCDHRAVVVRLLDATPGDWAAAREKLSARWRERTAAAVGDPAKVADLAPRDRALRARTLPDLVDAMLQ